MSAQAESKFYSLMPGEKLSSEQRRRLSNGDEPGNDLKVDFSQGMFKPPDWEIAKVKSGAESKIVQIAAKSGSQPSSTERILGTGFFIYDPAGTCSVVTDNHVLHDASRPDDAIFTVKTEDRQAYRASVTAVEKATDTALLSVDMPYSRSYCEGLPVIDRVDRVANGSAAVAISYPWNSPYQFISPGAVEDLITRHQVPTTRSLPDELMSRPMFKMIMHTMPGSSGAPVMLQDGTVFAKVATSHGKSFSTAAPFGEGDAIRLYAQRDYCQRLEPDPNDGFIARQLKSIKTWLYKDYCAFDPRSNNQAFRDMEKNTARLEQGR